MIRLNILYEISGLEIMRSGVVGVCTLDLCDLVVSGVFQQRMGGRFHILKVV